MWTSGIPLLGQASSKLGPRVPAFVVSALTPRLTVLHDTFDHSSIAATILWRFCSPRPPHLSGRVSAPRDVRGAISLTTPRDLRAMFDSLVVLHMQPAAHGPVGYSQPDDDHALMAAISLTVG
jgi:hypothetical protein